MKRVFGLAIAILAMAFWAGSAMADGGGGCNWQCAPGNSSNQSASIGQAGTSNATATNSANGAGASTSAVSVSTNEAGVEQTSVQVSDDSLNTSSQSAGVFQLAQSDATANNSGAFANTNAASVASNEAYVDQDVFQFGFDGVWNDASQSSNWNFQFAGASSLAQNAAHCANTNAAAVSLNAGEVDQLAFQIAWTDHDYHHHHH